MKSKILKSTVPGLLLPWLYFVFINVQPVKYISSGGKVVTGSDGVAGFIEFYGFADSISIYGVSFIVIFLLVFITLTGYGEFRRIVSK